MSGLNDYVRTGFADLVEFILEVINTDALISR